ncbi:MAG: hypothetical protein HY089_12140 [Ignavibacteriales bacterium]|nr:hypothetical protein [Ignavibacteriales bacterium]
MAKTKQKAPEYTLNIFRHRDERTDTTNIVFLVQTVKEFTNFKYEILLNGERNGKSLELNILGLRTTPLIMPGVGPAIGRKDFPNLKGTYALKVTKLDGEVNLFQLELAAKKITVKQSEQHIFIRVSTETVSLNEH